MIFFFDTVDGTQKNHSSDRTGELEVAWHKTDYHHTRYLSFPKGLLLQMEIKVID